MLRDPENYFCGVRRRAEPSPDNILAFFRRSPAALQTPNGAFEFHHRWVLVVALKGEGTLLLDRRPLRLRAGWAVLLPPLHLHGYQKLQSVIQWLFVTFEWSGHSFLSEEWLGPRRLPPETVHSLNAVLQLLALQAEIPGPAHGSLVAAHLHEALRSLYPASQTAAPQLSQPDNLIATVRSAAASHPQARLLELARFIGMSESHLRARFRAETGISLGRFLRETRLRQAAIALREEGISVKTAAARAGYPDVCAFSRAFSRALGQPPSIMC